MLSKQIAGFINSVCTNGINQYLVTADRIANWSPVAKRYQLGSDYRIARTKVRVITVKKKLIVKLHVDPS